MEFPNTFLLWVKYIVSKLFTVVAICALLFQVIDVNKIYFEFQVVTGVKVYIPEPNIPQAVSLCIRYYDLIDFDQMSEDTGLSFSYKQDDSIVRSIQANLTISDIFK